MKFQSLFSGKYKKNIHLWFFIQRDNIIYKTKYLDVNV